MSPLAARTPLAVSIDVLRALAHVNAVQGCRSSAVPLFRRAAAARTHDGAGRRRDDPLSLCGLAQLLLAPRRQPPPPLSLSPASGQGGHSGGAGAGGPESEPEPQNVSSADTPGALLAGALIFPIDEDKDEAARLLVRAFAAAGGSVPRKSVYFGGAAGDHDDDDVCVADDGVVRSEVQKVLAEVHLAVSGFSLKQRGGGAALRRSGGRGDEGAKEWHLREAARASPNTKTGIIARCVTW